MDCMGASSYLDWLVYVLGWAVGIGGLGLLARALFGDRSRGRRRCPRCWYDMFGISGLGCPECGRACRTETALRCTRRHWRPAVVGALGLLAGLALGSAPAYRQGGWVRLVPSSALVFLAPPAEQLWPNGGRVKYGQPRWDAWDEMTEETWRRLTNGRMARWQSQLFVSRYFGAALPSERLERRVVTPTRWSTDWPIAVLAPVVGPSALAFEMRVPGGAWTAAEPPGAGIAALGPLTDYWLRPPQPAGSSLNLDIRLRAGERVVWEGSRAFPIAIAGTASTFLERRQSPIDDERVRAAVRPSLVRGVGRLYLRINHRWDEPLWNAIDFRVFVSAELRREGAVVARARAVPETWCSPEWEWVYLMPMADAEPETREPMFELVLRGDAEQAGRDYLSRPFGGRPPACWAGELVIPVSRVPRGIDPVNP